MVVFLLFEREGVINRDGMASSLRDGSKACQSNEQRAIGDVVAGEEASFSMCGSSKIYASSKSARSLSRDGG